MNRISLRLLEARETGSGDRVWVEVPRPVGTHAPSRPRALLLIVIGAALVFGTLVTGRPQVHRPQPDVVRVTVAPRDTLWTLAQKHAPGQYPPAEVYQIRRANHLATSTLQPGQTLLIPVEKPVQIRWQRDAAFAR